MLGYSDSVRDGSSLASDAFVARAGIELKHVQEGINQEYDTNIQLLFYRGRGDTLPRGFGGNIKKAILSQSVTALHEEYTEQNRYLRRYSSDSSAFDHLWSVFSAHVSAVVRLPHPSSDIFQRNFEFFGRISVIAWESLVRGKTGEIYFSVLAKCK
jgi:phosphoenolpyruvate carboxylase